MTVATFRRALHRALLLMRTRGTAGLLACAIVTSVSAGRGMANEIDHMALNLEKSCTNHFRQRPNRPSNDSKKFCSCFAAEFTAMISLREIDNAGGVLTPEIQQQFERAADECGRVVTPGVAQAGKAWAGLGN